MNRNRLALAVLTAAVLVLAGVVTVSVHNGNAAASAVRDYVDAIARGDAAAANSFVDPTVFADGVDPALLASTLAGARERIAIGDVDVSPGAERGADVVPVQVTFSLDGADTTVELRAKRAGATLGVLHDWVVVDPLLVPVRIATNEPRLDTALLGDTTVPVGGTVHTGFPDRRFFVYPGIYDLGGNDSIYLGLATQQITATVPGYGNRPANNDEQLIEAFLNYEETPELVAVVTERLAEHLTECIAGLPTERPDCPADLYLDGGSGFRVDQQPTLGNLTVAEDKPSPEPALVFWTRDGELAYTAADGTPRSTPFALFCLVSVDPDDHLTLAFTRDP